MKKEPSTTITANCTHAKIRFAAVWMLILFVLILVRAPGIDFYLTSSDHGYQISMGMFVLKGQLPFVDTFFAYGPLVALTSALGLAFSGSLVPETIICALGYALSLTLIFYLVREYGPKPDRYALILALLVSFIGFLYLARFYKWYYWLFPLLQLTCMHGYINSAEKRLRWAAVAGVIAGVGGLYRADLAVAFVGAWSIFGILSCSRTLDVRRFLTTAAVFAACGLIVLVVLLAFLIQVGGTSSPGDYFRATLDGVIGHASNYASNYAKQPSQSFDWSAPFSERSSRYVLYVLTIAVYCSGLAYAGWKSFVDPSNKDTRAQFVLGCCSIGLAIFPQSLFGSGISHFQQVSPPMFIVTPVLAVLAWKVAGPQVLRVVVRSITVLTLAVLIVAGIRMYDRHRDDLESINFEAFDRFQTLSTLNTPQKNHPVADVVEFVRRHTQPDDRILVFSNMPQIYYFCDRRLSGMFNIYMSGHLDSDHWRARNMKVIKKNPPSLVIAPKRLFRFQEKNRLRRSQPELYAYLIEGYSRVVFETDLDYTKSRGGFLVLAPNDSPLPKVQQN